MSARNASRLTAILLFGVTATLCGAQTQPNVILRQDFANGQNGWTVMGTSAKVTVAKGEDANKAFLRFDYTIGKGEMGIALCMIPKESLTKARAVRFRIRASTATTIGFLMQEDGGGRFAAVFPASPDGWQEVVLAPGDFTLMDGSSDPKDANGKLDMDRVAGIGLVDIASMLGQAESPEAQALMGVITGPRNIDLDTLTITDEALPPVIVSAPGSIVLDACNRPQPGWMTVGGVRVSMDIGAPLDSRCVKATYQQAPGKIAAMVRPLTKGLLTGATGLSFNIASRQGTKVLVQVEETSGGKYNAMADLTGGEKAEIITLPFSGFTPADDSHDDNGKLNPEQIKSVMIIDVSGMMGGAQQANTLWMNKLKAILPTK